METRFLEVKWVGRGGQGIVTASRLLAEVALRRGKYAISIPMFGAERRGAPVVAYNRISDEPVRRKGPVRKADILVVADYRLLSMVNFFYEVKEKGLILFNADRVPPPLLNASKKVALVNATAIALKYGLELSGLAIVNAPLLGALIKVSSLAPLSTLKEVMKMYWGEEGGRRNFLCAKEAYEEVKYIT
ncbi:MAG: pyruvate ferredoxin oxidoreductase [Thermofilum sp. ex4484_15]|nr:MAG: pyruvate ferredoxin oxidoreductase [Thermofilum sp. ex4484_15]